MAEALAALSVFVNVLTVAEFVWKILEKSHEIEKTGRGALVDNVALEECSRELVAKNEHLQQSIWQSSRLPSDERDEDEEALNKLALECNNEANKLIVALRELASKGAGSKYQNVRAALKSAWRKDEIDATVRRMKGYEDAMHNRLMLSMSLKQKAIAAQQTEGFQKLLARDDDMAEALKQIQHTQRQTASTQGTQHQALVNIMASQHEELMTALSDDRSPAPLGDGSSTVSPRHDLASRDDSKQKLIELIKAEQLDAVKELLIQKRVLAMQTLDHNERTALHFAAAAGSLNLIKALIKKGANVDAQEEDNSTPLHLAVKAHAPACVRFLVFMGANREAKDDRMRTPVQYTTPFDESAWILCNGHEVNARDSKGDTALMNFIKRRNTLGIKSLLSQEAPHTYQTGNGGDRTPLVFASEKGYMDIVALLTEAGADVNFETAHRDSPLSIAARYGQLKIVQFLLDHGADVASENSVALTPLLEAANNGHDTIGELLVQNGAPVDTMWKDGGQAAIHQAAKSGCVKTVAAILKKNPLYAGLRTRDRWRPLDEGCWWGQEAVADLMLDYGPDLRWFGNHLGRTPLQLAASAGFERVIRLLVEKGRADVEATGSTGHTALILAIDHKHYNAARELLRLGADPNHMENYQGGWLPLTFAINNGTHEMLRLLLNESNIDPNRRNDDVGCTPLIEAVRRNSITMADDLLEAGADANAYAVDPRLDNGRNYPPVCFAAMDAPRKGLGMLKLLVEKGKADLSASNATHKWTALHEVGCHGPLDAVKYLLEHGADPDVTGIDPKNGGPVKPLDLALQENRGQIATVLGQAMAERAREREKKAKEEAQRKKEDEEAKKVGPEERTEGWHVVERHEREQEQEAIAL